METKICIAYCMTLRDGFSSPLLVAYHGVFVALVEAERARTTREAQDVAREHQVDQLLVAIVVEALQRKQEHINLMKYTKMQNGVRNSRCCSYLFSSSMTNTMKKNK